MSIQEPVGREFAEDVVPDGLHEDRPLVDLSPCGLSFDFDRAKKLLRHVIGGMWDFTEGHEPDSFAEVATLAGMVHGTVLELSWLGQKLDEACGARKGVGSV